MPKRQLIINDHKIALLNAIQDCNNIYAIIVHTPNSQMSYGFKFFIIKNNELLNVTHEISDYLTIHKRLFNGERGCILTGHDYVEELENLVNLLRENINVNLFITLI